VSRIWDCHCGVWSSPQAFSQLYSVCSTSLPHMSSATSSWALQAVKLEATEQRSQKPSPSRARHSVTPPVRLDLVAHSHLFFPHTHKRNPEDRDGLASPSSRSQLVKTTSNSQSGKAEVHQFYQQFRDRLLLNTPSTVLRCPNRLPCRMRDLQCIVRRT